MGWLLIVLLVIAMLVVSKLVHFKHLKHKLTAIIIVLLLFFLYLSFTTIVKNNSITLSNVSGIFSAVKIYFSWLVHVFGNLKDITGNVVKMDWFPQNITS